MTPMSLRVLLGGLSFWLLGFFQVGTVIAASTPPEALNVVTFNAGLLRLKGIDAVPYSAPFLGVLGSAAVSVLEKELVPLVVARAQLLPGH